MTGSCVGDRALLNLAALGYGVMEHPPRGPEQSGEKLCRIQRMLHESDES
jgi:hypothetical protein